MKRSPVRGQITLLIVAASVLLGLGGVLAISWRGGWSSTAGDGRTDTAIVRRGDFDISLPVSGELSALNQIEIRNRLDRQAILTEIVAEGKFVNTGDVLFKLNDDELRNQVKDGVDEVNVAEAAAITATADLDITIKEQESELAKADLAIRLAEIALRAWQEPGGEDQAKLSELNQALKTAKMDADRLKDRFEDSAKLLEQKFISRDEFLQDEIALRKAEAEVEQSTLKLNLYEKYTRVQDEAKKTSDLKEAQDERGRVEDKYKAKVQSAQSEMESKKYQLESKRERLRLQEQQLSYCTMTAPSPGLVVYYSSLDSGYRWGGGEGPPQVGTQIYPNQTVIILPDTTKMVAGVKVSETLSGLIKVGQRATVTSDAIPDRILEGEVQSVGVLAESGGWRDPNRRDYTVKILLKDGEDLGLKPSMRCKANINVGQVEDALHIPVQAIFRNGSLSYVYVPDGSGYAQCKVALGQSSELFIEVTEGLDEGQTVLLREPESHEIASRIVPPKDDKNNGRNGRGKREQPLEPNDKPAEFKEDLPATDEAETHSNAAEESRAEPPVGTAQQPTAAPISE